MAVISSKISYPACFSKLYYTSRKQGVCVYTVCLRKNKTDPGIDQIDSATTLAFRPVNGKVVPARQPASKGAPERPPPPKLAASRTSNKKLLLSRSSSDMDLQKKQGNLASGLSKAKSQVFKNQDPVLPPRPKPGHPLYRKYMVS